ncbi:TPA: hypothetical protein NOY28_003186 [Escherichia coli]|jgi:hypothetical protein|uniref:hypothetical protein n=1 Tax=Escherichia coli TaxID=562 RepID=UPI0004D4C1D6|nr:hypothetical protein [Escherichia coli]EGD7493955.1 hypothetical protein [Shigella dysenteriae]EJQ0105423.1 hypothetical protein [Shigella flexneri]EEV2401545.1 hypothetical protein [Escherichia coli]EFD4990944.1 hypothetical protein [Escherichia coli]EFD9489715.1 hypothetical protein [Escherichia coli]
MTVKKYTTLRVPEEKKMALERAAIEISYITGKPYRWTDLTFYVIDNYLKEAIKDLKASGKK